MEVPLQAEAHPCGRRETAAYILCMGTINAAAEAERERARKGNGQFGAHEQHAEPKGVVDDYPRRARSGHPAEGAFIGECRGGGADRVQRVVEVADIGLLLGEEVEVAAYSVPRWAVRAVPPAR